MEFEAEIWIMGKGELPISYIFGFFLKLFVLFYHENRNLKKFLVKTALQAIFENSISPLTEINSLSLRIVAVSITP